jgi:hypothetical protein
MRQQFVDLRLGLPAVLVHQRPTSGRGNHDFGCPGGTMIVGILPRLIHIERVVGMLDGRNAQSTSDQLGQ